MIINPRSEVIVINSKVKSMKLIALKVKQPLGDFFITKIAAKKLDEISTSSVLRYTKDGTLEGNQRKLDVSRLKSIAKFIISDEMCFPTSILVAGNINTDSGHIIEDERERWTVRSLDQHDLYEIVIPDGRKSALIIDGQHRLNAFRYSNEECGNIELICSIFLDLPTPYQAYLFATVNGNQKKVDKSLALELFGYDVENEPENTWSPEKLAVFLSRKLNFTEDSPLFQKIKLAPLYDDLEEFVDRSKWLLSMAAMVEGILKLISTNPQSDRDALAYKKSSIWGDKTRKILSSREDKSVLRLQYLNNNDEEIYSILHRYFTAVNRFLWIDAPNNSVIRKTIGISVLFDLLKSIISSYGIDASFDEYISKIRHIDYTSEYFALSGGGKTKLRRILKYTMGLIDETQLYDQDRQFLSM